MQDTAKAPMPKDGRHLRSERSRTVIARAMLELVREEGTMPTTDSVADRASVSRRSVFRHYSDVSELLSAAYELQRRETLEKFPATDFSGFEGAERLDAYVKRVCDIHEDVASVRRAAVHMAHDYPVLCELLRHDDTQQKKAIIELFGDVVASHPDASGMIAALVSASSWSHWNFLRTDHSLSAPDARKVVKSLMGGVLCVAETARVKH